MIVFWKRSIGTASVKVARSKYRTCARVAREWARRRVASLTGDQQGPPLHLGQILGDS